MWGYLSEFWDSISSSTVSAGEYTIGWFENVGNAVAGAIGGLFDDLVHHIYDFFYLIRWFLDGLQELFSIIISPLTWGYNFARGLFASGFSTADELGLETGELQAFEESVSGFFEVFPYADYIFLGVSAMLGIVFLVFVIKKLSEI
jgi:hypothetical protein